MLFTVNYQMRRYQNEVKYSPVLNFFMSDPIFGVRF